MNALLTELAQLEGEIRSLEQEALKHEQLARECRDRRLEHKRRLSELHALINDAKVVHAAQGAMAQAQAARQEAEAAKVESLALLDALKAKLEEVGATKAALDQVLSVLPSGHPAAASAAPVAAEVASPPSV